jgi:osmotically-inducible protein OsmY
MKTLTKFKFTGVCVSIICLLGLSACNQTDTSATDTTGENVDQMADDATSSMDQATDRAAEVIDDAGITAKVKAAIMAEPGLDSLQINVDTVNGVVTLTGSADSPANSDKAAGVASGIADVKSVENRLEVEAGS